MDAPHERLASLRAFTGLSANAFGVRIGCSGQMVGMIERNERSPGRDIVIAVERVSNAPREDGELWPDRPLAIEEWDHHKPAAAVDTAPSLPPLPPVVHAAAHVAALVDEVKLTVLEQEAKAS